MAPEVVNTESLARALRVHALRMVHHADASHIGSCLSIADILAVLYGRVLRVDASRPDWPDRDRFILSKGHAGAVLYAVLAERGFFPPEWLREYCDDGACLLGHISHHVPGVELSTGSLGHGLSVGCGLALAGQRGGRPYRVVVLLGDGEQNEGSVWEAVSFAAHHQLTGLTAIVDVNGLQGFGTTREVMCLDPLAPKWRAFGWQAEEVDGHDHEQLATVLSRAVGGTEGPTVVLARTVKGKGVRFMENQLAWHYRSPNDAQLSEALRDLGVQG